jgi:large subunit ribosomal protein L20
VRALKGLALPRASHSSEITLAGSRRLRSTLAAAPVFSAHAVVTVAKNKYEKGLQYAYRDRKAKKREFRALWIQRINAGARIHGVSYSQLMGLLKKAEIELNRKVLADLAMNHAEAFKAVVERVK